MAARWSGVYGRACSPEEEQVCVCVSCRSTAYTETLRQSGEKAEWRPRANDVFELAFRAERQGGGVGHPVTRPFAIVSMELPFNGLSCRSILQSGSRHLRLLKPHAEEEVPGRSRVVSPPRLSPPPRRRGESQLGAWRVNLYMYRVKRVCVGVSVVWLCACVCVSPSLPLSFSLSPSRVK